MPEPLESSGDAAGKYFRIWPIIQVEVRQLYHQNKSIQTLIGLRKNLSLLKNNSNPQSTSEPLGQASNTIYMNLSLERASGVAARVQVAAATRSTLQPLCLTS